MKDHERASIRPCESPDDCGTVCHCGMTDAEHTIFDGHQFTAMVCSACEYRSASAFKYRVGEYGTNDRDQAMRMSRYWGLHLHVQAGPRNGTVWFWAGSRWNSLEELRLASYRTAFGKLRGRGIVQGVKRM